MAQPNAQYEITHMYYPVNPATLRVEQKVYMADESNVEVCLVVVGDPLDRDVEFTLSPQPETADGI